MSDVVHGVELRASVAGQTDREITLNYLVENSSGGRIYVFDSVLKFDEKGATKLDPGGAYVFKESDTAARVVRGIVGPPMFMAVSRRPPIVGTPVELGASKRGTVRLALPLTESNPYFPPQECDANTAKPVSKLILQIGWVEHRPETNVSAYSIDQTELVRLNGGWGLPLQRVAQAEVPVRGVELCPRAGAFDRPLLRVK